MLWPAVFAAVTVADLITTHLAVSRGLREGNPLLRAWNPAVLIVALSALIVAPAEVCRALGVQGVDIIYAGGAAPHAVAAVLNTIQIMRRK